MNVRHTAKTALVIAVVGASFQPVGAHSEGHNVTSLRDEADVVLEGDGGLYTKVVAAGDVNDDGIQDLLVSQVEFQGELTRGRNWVVFGRDPMPSTIELSESGVADGFVIQGADKGDMSYWSAGLGDVNSDGLDDVAIGGGGVDNNGRPSSGSTYVVFGKADKDPVDLALFDQDRQGMVGFRVDGPVDGAFLGGSGVAGPGDVNGDGLADILIAASFVGRSYVVFGKTDTSAIDLASLEREDADEEPLGFRIETSVAPISAAYAVGGAGDVNGDGTPDLVIGHLGGIRDGRAIGPSCACVVFGKADGQPVTMRALGDDGFKIKGPQLYWAASGAGDVNGDGKSDVIAGGHSGGHCCGRAFVVFGKSDSSTVRTRRLRGRGYALIGSGRVGGFGSDLAAAGDVDSDGKDDVLIGAPASYGKGAEGRSATGAAYLVYGRKRFARIDVSGPAPRVRELRGSQPRDYAGSWVAGMPDLNGDGVPELLIGSDVGQAYIVYG